MLLLLFLSFVSMTLTHCSDLIMNKFDDMIIIFRYLTYLVGKLLLRNRFVKAYVGWHILRLMLSNIT